MVPHTIGIIGGLGVGAGVHYYKELAAAHDAIGKPLALVMVHAQMKRIFEHASKGDASGLAHYLEEVIGQLLSISPLPLVNMLDAIRAELQVRGLLAPRSGNRDASAGGGRLHPQHLLFDRQHGRRQRRAASSPDDAGQDAWRARRRGGGPACRHGPVGHLQRDQHRFPSSGLRPCAHSGDHGPPMLVNCVSYQRGQKLADIPVTEIRASLSQPDCFVWVAIKDPEPGELETMADEFDLHPLAVEDAQKGHQRPKIEEYGSSLFVVLHVVEENGGELQTGEVSIFVGPQYVISVRRGTQQGFTEVRRRCEQEPDLLQHGPAYVLYALMDTVVDRYFPVLDALTAEIEEVEERIFTGQTTRAQIEALSSLRRKLTVLDHAGVPLLEVTGKLHGGRVPPICNGLHEYFRDVYDHLLRLKQSVDSLRDVVATVISMNLSLITIQENEVTKRLAAYAALIAVPTMIAGVYGMNFTHMPEIEWVWGYPLSLGVMVVIDAYLVYRFKKTKWM